MKIILFCFALLLLFNGCGKKIIAQDCAGHVIAGEGKLFPGLPSNAHTLDVNQDGLMDALVSTPDGGTLLYISCNEKNALMVMESSTTFLPQKVHEDEQWTPFILNAEGDQSLIISERHYRLSMLPFQAENDLPSLEINFDGEQYGIDLAYCKALGIHAPLYSIIAYEEDPDHRVTIMRAQIGEKTYMIHADAQEEFNIGITEAVDANTDGIDDMILYFSDRYGSGRERLGALLLGCSSSDEYILSGIMRVSIAGTDAHPKRTEGGFIVKQYIEPSLENPQEKKRIFQGYYLDSKTLGLLPGMRSFDRKKVIENLINREL